MRRPSRRPSAFPPPPPDGVRSQPRRDSCALFNCDDAPVLRVRRRRRQRRQHINIIHVTTVYSRLPKLASSCHGGRVTPCMVECLHELDSLFDKHDPDRLGVRVVRRCDAAQCTTSFYGAGDAGVLAGCSCRAGTAAHLITSTHSPRLDPSTHGQPSWLPARHRRRLSLLFGAGPSCPTPRNRDTSRRVPFCRAA